MFKQKDSSYHRGRRRSRLKLNADVWGYLPKYMQDKLTTWRNEDVHIDHR